MALHGHLITLKLLVLKVRAELNAASVEVMLGASDSCGYTPLMDAILGDKLDVVKFLVDINQVNTHDKCHLI